VTFAEPHRCGRDRATKAEVEHRRDALVSIVREMRPMTVRQVYYQAVVQKLVEKTVSGWFAREIADRPSRPRR